MLKINITGDHLKINANLCTGMGGMDLKINIGVMTKNNESVHCHGRNDSNK